MLRSLPNPNSFGLPKIDIFVILDKISIYTRHSRVTANLIDEIPQKSAVYVFNLVLLVAQDYGYMSIYDNSNSDNL